MLDENSHRQSLAEQIARDEGFLLHKKYAEKYASRFLGVSVGTLRRLRHAGRIAYVQISERRNAYFGFQIADFLIDQIQCPIAHPKEYSNSGTTGSLDSPAAPLGVEPGLITPLDKQGALACARRILQKPSNV